MSRPNAEPSIQTATGVADLPWRQYADASIALLEQFLAPDQADQLLLAARSWPDWQQRHISVYGHRCAEPRLGLWYADPGVHYRYSGHTCRARAWPAALQSLRELLQDRLQQPFNAVLGNLYRNGNDAMGWHSDDERCLGQRPVIASISLGANRDFLLRRKDDHARQLKLSLQHGSLLVMAGCTQRHWQHALPRRKAIDAVRINLTFRKILDLHH